MSYTTIKDLGVFPKGKFIHMLNVNYSHGWDEELYFCKGPVVDDPNQYWSGGTLYVKYSYAKASQNAKKIVSKISWQPESGLKSGQVNTSRYYIWEDGPDTIRYFMQGFICAIFDRLQDGRP